VLRSFLRPTKPEPTASTHRAHSGITGTGVAGSGASGVTLLLAVEAALVPAAFVAVTVKVYAVPFVRPVTVQEVPDVVQLGLVVAV
jgi:hypothetical protein